MIRGLKRSASLHFFFYKLLQNTCPDVRKKELTTVIAKNIIVR